MNKINIRCPICNALGIFKKSYEISYFKKHKLKKILTANKKIFDHTMNKRLMVYEYMSECLLFNCKCGSKINITSTYNYDFYTGELIWTDSYSALEYRLYNTIIIYDKYSNEDSVFLHIFTKNTNNELRLAASFSNVGVILKSLNHLKAIMMFY